MYIVKESLPEGVSSELLTDYFSKFGVVDKIDITWGRKGGNVEVKFGKHFVEKHCLIVQNIESEKVHCFECRGCPRNRPYRTIMWWRGQFWTVSTTGPLRQKFGSHWKAARP